MNSDKIKKIDRADAIINGDIKLGQERIIDGGKNHFAYLFICLLQRRKNKILPVDTIKLNEADNQLEFLAKSQGVFYDIHILASDWYKTEEDEYIAKYKNSGKEVLLIKKHDRYHYYDPYENIIEPVNEENAEQIEKEVIRVFPSSKAKTVIGLCKEAFLWNKKDFLRYLGLTVLPIVAIALFFALLSNTDQVNLILEKPMDMLEMLILLGAVSAIMLSINVIVARTNARIAGRTRSYIFPVVMGRLLSMKSSSANAVSRDLMSTFVMFIESLDTMINNLLNAGVYIFYCIIGILCIKSMNLKAGVGGTKGAILICAVFLVFICFKMVSITTRRHNTAAKLSETRKEIIDSSSTIKNFAEEDTFYQRFAVSYGDYSDARLSYDKYTNFTSITVTLLSGLAVFMIFLFNFMSDGNAEGSASYVPMLSVLGMLGNYMLGLTNAVIEIINSYSDFSFGNTILKNESELDNDGNCNIKLKGKIEFSNVSFRYYDGGPQILRDISFTIEPNEYVAIVGGSGSGKSTLIRLLLGFEELKEGEIRYDDIPANQFNLQSLRSQMGVVLQNEGIIGGSVKLNISLEDEPDMERVKAAAEKAAIADEIEKWPMKYNTVLSGESELISGGQKQRIVIARALFNNPKILVLDEATSAMDNITQDIVKKNLDDLGCTRIVIAHRLSTIVDCDKIIVLDNGKICEMGTYDELMEKNGVFARMAKRNMI